MTRRWAVMFAVMLMSVVLFGQTALAVPPPPPQIRDAFKDRWMQADEPVQAGVVQRTWVWGKPLNGWVPQWQPYQDPALGPAGGIGSIRAVLYFDKGRMEDNSWQTQQAPWNITSGLLVEELITGRIQTGTTTFEQKQPAQIPVAGDSDSTVTPMYATLAPLKTFQPIPHGWSITQTLSADGTVANDPGNMRFGVTAVDVGAPTHHTVASVFWKFMNSSGTLYDLQTQTYYQGQLFENPFYVTGYPLTEPYWTKAKVGGKIKDVLLQCFERRCLTYTPDNPDGWKVEFGNVGQHYYFWRYGTRPWE